MTVLVSGATGFIGGAVATTLCAQGTQVRALVRNPGHPAVARLRNAGADIAFGDLTAPRTLADAARGTDAVFHAAAHLADTGPAETFRRVNVEGTRSLLAAAADAGVRRFVFVSSPSALMSPDGGDQIGIDERVGYPTRFFNHYCATKAQAEQLVLDADSTGMTTTALRPRAVWGPGDSRGPIAVVLTRLAAGRIPDLDPGHSVYASLCYIDHCVAAALAALTAPRDIIGGRAYFIADAQPVDIWPMLRDIAGEFGLAPPHPRLPPAAVTAAARVADVIWRLPALAHHRTPPVSAYTIALLTRTATYDTSAARRDLGVEPWISRAEGISRLHTWVDSIGGVAALGSAA